MKTQITLRKSKCSGSCFLEGPSEMAVQGLEVIKAAGIYLNDVECTICLYPFTEVMSIDEQQSKGVSQEQLQAMNEEMSSEERCWRNRANPCGHAAVNFSLPVNF